MGPTKVYQAVYSAPGTIRAEYGLTDTRNATHGSGDGHFALSFGIIKKFIHVDYGVLMIVPHYFRLHKISYQRNVSIFSKF